MTSRKDVKQKKEAIEKIIVESHGSSVYFFLLSISAAVSTFGIILGSEAIIIGGMLLGPFLAPLMALALGFTTLSLEATLKAVINTLASIILVIFISGVLGIALDASLPIELISSWSDFLYLYLAVALFSGAAAAFLWVRPKLSSSQAGVAVSISIIPPLCVTGLALGFYQFDLAIQSIRVFAINVLGIVTSATIVFTLMNLTKYKDVQKKEIKEVEKEEKEKIKNLI